MLPILVFTKPATTLLARHVLEVKMPMLAKPARTHVMATTGAEPGLDRRAYSAAEARPDRRVGPDDEQTEDQVDLLNRADASSRQTRKSFIAS